MKKLLLSLIILMMISLPLFAEGESDAPLMPSMETNHIRGKAMGNAFTALANDFHVLFDNPAAMALPKAEKENTISLIDLGVSLSGDSVALLQEFASDPQAAMDKYYNVYQKVSSGDFSADTLAALDEISRFRYALAFVPGIIPLSFGLNFQNWGIAADFNVGVDLWSKKNIIPSLYTDVGVSYQLKGGYARRIKIGPFKLDLGGALKVFIYGNYKDELTAGDVPADAMNDPDTGMEEYIRTVLKPAAIGFGVGIDAGATFTVFDFKHLKWRVALVVDDLFSPVWLTTGDQLMAMYQDGAKFDFNDWSLIAPNLKIGTALLFPKLPIIPEFIMSDLSVTGDFKHLLHPVLAGEYGNLISMMHFGAEVKMLKKFIALRMGFNQGFWTGGLGFDLGPVDIDYAFYQEEMGADPGNFAAISHMIGVSLRFGGGYRKLGKDKE